MIDCQNRDKNLEGCTCTKTECRHHGICCTCVAAHRAKGGLPSCLHNLKKPAE